MKKWIIEHRYLRSLYQLENLYKTYFILFFSFSGSLIQVTFLHN